MSEDKGMDWESLAREVEATRNEPEPQSVTNLGVNSALASIAMIEAMLRNERHAVARLATDIAKSHGNRGLLQLFFDLSEFAGSLARFIELTSKHGPTVTQIIADQRIARLRARQR